MHSMLRSIFTSRKQNYIFPTVDPEEDGPDCFKDCASCTVKFPSKVKVETSAPLYGHLKAFGAQVLIATGKTDLTRKIEEEHGSLAEALDASSSKSSQGVCSPFQEEDVLLTDRSTQKLLISASNLEPYEDNGDGATTVLILPSFTFVDSVTPGNASELIERFVNSPPRESSDPKSQLTSRPCPHDYVFLLCSHKHRDARCGLTAPLIKKELERHLRPLGLYRDMDDLRPGGTGIYFVSHVGGHKFSANLLIYRRREQQMIWLARVRPEHCEGIVKYTMLEGKVVHPDSQLRGGFDRARGLTSW